MSKHIFVCPNCRQKCTVQLKYDRLLISMICPSCKHQWEVMGSEGKSQKRVEAPKKPVISNHKNEGNKDAGSQCSLNIPVNQFACPECGFVLLPHSSFASGTTVKITCPRCHYKWKTEFVSGIEKKPDGTELSEVGREIFRRQWKEAEDAPHSSPRRAGKIHWPWRRVPVRD